MGEVSVLLTYPSCQVVRFRNGSKEPDEILAEGCLKVLEVNADQGAEVGGALLVFFVGSPESVGVGSGVPKDGEYYYPVLGSTPVCVASSGCITVPALSSTSAAAATPAITDVVGFILLPPDEGFVGSVPTTKDLMQLLSAKGVCVKVQQKIGQKVQWVNFVVEQSGNSVSEAIALGAGVLAWGIRQGGEFMKKNLTPKEEAAAVPTAVKQGTHTARDVSKQAVDLSKNVMGAIISTAAQMGTAIAGSGASDKVPDSVKVVGETGIKAGMQVWTALQDAGDTLVAETCDTTADVVGYKYGEDAGATAREGMHVVGNVISVKNQMSGKTVAKKIIKGTAIETAKGVAGVPEAEPSEASSSGYSSAAAATTTKPSGGIRLGPKK